MANQMETISYNIDEFMKYKNNNKEIPSGILPYCYNLREVNEPNMQQYIEHIKMINESIKKKIDVNDVVFKNETRHFVNTINNSNRRNYNGILSKFKDLSKEHVQFLAQELIVCAMRCPVGIKGIHKEKTTKSKSISENITDIIKYFCNNITKENNNGVGFHDELLKLCRKFFMEFVNLTKFMDQNNENTSDSYKGFMTLLGLLYENNLIQQKIIMDCVDSIKRTIFCYKIDKKTEQITNNLTDKHEKMFGPNKNFDTELYDKIAYFDTENIEQLSDNKYICYRSIMECVNFYKGYENLSFHYVNSFNKRMSDLNKQLHVYNRIYNGLMNGTDKDMINNIFTENNMSVSEENKKNLIEKYGELINGSKQQVEKYIGFLDVFIKSHSEIENLNEVFRTKNKDQLSVPLKAHIMIIHNEISQNANKNLENLKNLVE